LVCDKLLKDERLGDLGGLRRWVLGVRLGAPIHYRWDLSHESKGHSREEDVRGYPDLACRIDS
jgi:hypothetical protein